MRERVSGEIGRAGPPGRSAHRMNAGSVVRTSPGVTAVCIVECVNSVTFCEAMEQKEFIGEKSDESAAKRATKAR